MEWLGVLNYAIPIFLVVLGFVTGRIIERRHFARLSRREAAPGAILTNLRSLPDGSRPAAGTLCMGSVVIGADAFKTLGASLKTLIGGRMRTLETLLQRGRREALLRMREQADRCGADLVLNVRIETSRLQKSMAEVIAYGTAVKFAQDT